MNTTLVLDALNKVSGQFAAGAAAALNHLAGPNPIDSDMIATFRQVAPKYAAALQQATDQTVPMDSVLSWIVADGSQFLERLPGRLEQYALDAHSAIAG